MRELPQDFRVLFAGSGAFGVPTLESLAGGGHVVGVYTQPDKPAGRGNKLTPTPIAKAAEALGLPLTRTANLNDEQLPAADALVVIAFGQWVGGRVKRHPTHGAINLHASLLPRHRGAAPIHGAVLAGDDETGNSVIRLAKTMDAGRVLGQSRRPVGDDQTTGELHDLLAADGPVLVRRVLAELAAGTAEEVSQDPALATHQGKLARADAVLDFTRDARSVARRINGLSPWPGCRVTVGGQTVTLLKARPVAGSGEPGEITADGTIACGSGSVEVLTLQPSGKKPMTLKDYRNGRAWDAGTKVEAVDSRVTA